MRDRVVPALFAGALWLGCEGGLLTVHVDEEDEVVVPAGSLLEQLLGDLGFDGFLDMDVTASEEFRNQGIEPGDADHGGLRRAGRGPDGLPRVAVHDPHDGHHRAPPRAGHHGAGILHAGGGSHGPGACHRLQGDTETP